MAKIKEGGKALNVIIDQRVFEMLEKYCFITGLTKTKAVERILEKDIQSFLKKENKIK